LTIRALRAFVSRSRLAAELKTTNAWEKDVALLAGIQGDTRGDIGKKAMTFSIVLSTVYIEYLAERKGAILTSNHVQHSPIIPGF
jgi:hypothetical protein